MATDWTALRVEYVNSAMQYKELAQRHGLKEGTVRQRANRDGWAEERNAVSRAVTQNANLTLAEDRVTALASFNEDDLRMARAIKARAEAMMSSATRPNDLRALAGAVKDAQMVGRLALGASTENSSVTTKELPASVNEFV